VIRDWPGQGQARSLRHWPTLVHIAERVERSDFLDALIVVGSFAKAQADEASDLDLLIAVSDGRFDEAWERRADLETPDALVAWDFRPEPQDRPIGTRKFLTRDVVKVEIQLSEPGPAGAKLAEPRYVLVGDAGAPTRYVPLDPIPSEVLNEYAQKIRDEGLVPDVEARYSELMEAIRRAR
jgi:predicted nucleotidyltransferase